MRANTRASTNILSTLYLDTARLVAQSEAFSPERFRWFRHNEMTLGAFTRKQLGSTVCAHVEESKKKKTAGSRAKGKETRSLHKKPWAGCANESLEKLCSGSASDSVTNRLPVQSGMSNRRGGGDRYSQEYFDIRIQGIYVSP